MEKSQIQKTVFALALLAALTIIILPASAVNGTIDIAYRGYGGNYIGDTIIFDGHNTFSNVTLLKITGPGLPAEGLPVYDMNGQVGSGNVVSIQSEGKWRFSWYTGSIKGSEKLQTARYYITAFDNSYPDKTATTSLLLKKPEFYVDVAPSIAGSGEYIQLTGIVEKGSNSVHFDIADADGKIVHAYDSTVSASGYFNKGFHVDMPTGIYTITMTSPSSKSIYRNYLTVNAATASPSPIAPVATLIPTGTAPVTPDATIVTPLPAGTGTLSVTSSPLGATVFVDSAMTGTTPLELNTVAAGDHLVEIKAPGYTTYAVQVPVKNGETTTINPVLIKGAAGTPLSLITIVCGLIAAVFIIRSRYSQRKP